MNVALLTMEIAPLPEESTFDFFSTVINFFEKLWEDATLIVNSFTAFAESLWHFKDIVPWFVIGSINFVLTIIIIKSIFFGGVDT